MNPNYDSIAKAFVQQYYSLFDTDPAQRASLGSFYQDGRSLMTFEGHQFMGKAPIIEKLQNLQFQKITHIVSVVDSQPTIDGGVVIVVLGQLKTDDDPPHTFNQTFVLKPDGGSFFIEHDIFRLALIS